jgi:hypothetical protein
MCGKGTGDNRGLGIYVISSSRLEWRAWLTSEIVTEVKIGHGRFLPSYDVAIYGT